MATAAAIQPDKILKDLRSLWGELASETETKGGVLRACEMTLIVAAESEQDLDEVRRLVGVLMKDHPARAIVLHLRDEEGMDARVFSECWMPFGKHQQICAEGIEITAGTGQMEELSHLLLPLVVSDLPVVLWARGRRAFSKTAFQAILPLVQKIIVDSRSSADDACNAVECLKELRKSGRLIADLAWTRLTGVRELLASLVDDGTLQPAEVKAVEVGYGTDRPSPSAVYLTSWLAQALPQAKVERHSVAGEMGLRSITFEGGGDVKMSRPDQLSFEVRTDGKTRRSTLGLVSDETLMREELSILGPDPVFDRLLA